MTLVLTSVKAEVVSLHKNGNLCTKGLILCNFILPCAQKAVPLQRFCEKSVARKRKGYTLLINNYGFKDCCAGQASARHP